MAERDHVTDLRTVVMEGVADIAGRFKRPDADFTPVFFYVDGAGDVTIEKLPQADGDASEDEVERSKAFAARVIEAQLRRERAQAAALILSVWMAKAPPEFVQAAKGHTPEEVEIMARPYKASRQPDRHEVLWLQVTDGQRYELWLADLIRHEGAPPTVGEWHREENAEQSVGRFMLLKIFKRALGLR